jgi:hypothetical protein
MIYHINTVKHLFGIREVRFYLLLMLFIPQLASAEIIFDDVSHQAGIMKTSPTAAASWGDVNNDGWPDLWVSNHHGKLPSLYLNQQNGSFIDVTKKYLSDNPRVDFHGVAWADFDNDGDQDLIATTGGGAGRGISPNHLYVNDNGELLNKAKEYGLDYPLGRGRTPLWVDINQDGKLDVILMNHPHKKAPSAVFIQKENGFTMRNKELDFLSSLEIKKVGYFDRLKQFFRPEKSKSNMFQVGNEFAQLADLTGDRQPELIAYLKHSRIYSLNDSHKLQDLTKTVGVPYTRSIQDVAIDDFNGDGMMDIYLARSRPYALEVIQPDSLSIKGKIQTKPDKVRSISFRSNGDVRFGVYRPWMDPSDPKKKKIPKLYIGADISDLPEQSFTIQQSNPSLRSSKDLKADDSESIAISYDSSSHIWTMKSTVRLVNFIITADKPIDMLKTHGFKSSKGDLKDSVLFKSNVKFIPQKSVPSDTKTACSSVASGDFDNDMDVDLYLVCSSPIGNLPNILYENDGKGNFTKVAHAGGAAGSNEGRGNQVATVDYDRDGFLDLFVTNGLGAPPFSNKGPYQLFRNKGNANHWLEVDLKGVLSNKDGIGATLVFESNGTRQVRHQGGGMHSFSQNHSRIHVGLGASEFVDKITVYWPSGIIQHVGKTKSDQIIRITEQGSESNS